jgi:hypothetical protein
MKLTDCHSKSIINHPRTLIGGVSKFALIAGISFLAVDASNAALELTWDLRAVSTGAVNPANVSVNASINGIHTVNISDNSAGSTVVFDLYAVFNENVAGDTFQKVQGALVSSLTTGGLSGSITLAQTASNLSDTNAGAQNGLGGVDLSAVYDHSHGLLTSFTSGSVYANPSGISDGIKDWGDTVANRNLTPGNWFVAGNSATQALSTDAIDSSKRSILVGEFKLVLDAGASGSTSVGFYVRPKGTNAATAPAVAYTYNANTKSANYTGNTGTTVSPNDVFGFQNVSITAAVPEPSAFGMAMVGALGLIGFRRFGLRRA